MCKTVSESVRWIQHFACGASALSLLLGLLGCAALPAERDVWNEARTRHFRVISEVDAERTRELALELERFGTIAARVIGASEIPPRVPTTIVILRDKASYRRFAPANTDGIFVAGQRDNFALINAGSRVGGLGVLMHEYSHYVVHNGSSLAVPAWYDEGVAEVLRGTQLSGQYIDVSTPLADRNLTVPQSRMLPLERLLTENPQALGPLDSALFYAKAWHLVRYLRFGGRLGLRDRSAELDDYLARLRDGQSTEEAFAGAFQSDFLTLELELEDYLRKGPFPGVQLALASLPSPSRPELRALDSLEVARVLGTVALRTQQLARAEQLFRGVLASAPADARAHFGLATAQRLQGRAQQADALCERGLELEPNDALNQLDYAQNLLAHVDAGQGAELLERARGHLRRAIELDPELPEAQAQLAASYLLVAGADVERGLAAAERAHELLGSSSRISYLMAVAYYRLGRLDEARRFLVAARAQTHSPAPELATLQARIGDAEADGYVASSGAVETPPDVAPDASPDPALRR